MLQKKKKIMTFFTHPPSCALSCQPSVIIMRMSKNTTNPSRDNLVSPTAVMSLKKKTENE